MLAPAASERVFSQAGLNIRAHRSQLSKSMLAQLVFLKCNNNFLWNGRLHENKIYFVLLIAVVLLLVKLLQVSDLLWLSQNHKIRTTLCRPNYEKLSMLSLEKGLDLALARSRFGRENECLCFKSRQNVGRSRSRTEKQTSRSRTTRSHLHHCLAASQHIGT